MHMSISQDFILLCEEQLVSASALLLFHWLYLCRTSFVKLFFNLNPQFVTVPSHKRADCPAVYCNSVFKQEHMLRDQKNRNSYAVKYKDTLMLQGVSNIFVPPRTIIFCLETDLIDKTTRQGCLF